MTKKFWPLLVMMVFFIILDQMTKGYIESNFFYGESIPVIKNFFHITFVKNKGAAWGMGASSEGWVRLVFLKYGPLALCFYLLYLIFHSIRDKNQFLALAFSFVLAGAIGNLIDRFSVNYVVDFLDFFWGHNHFPAFNVADSCITIGGFMIGIDALILTPKRNKEKTSTQKVSS